MQLWGCAALLCRRLLRFALLKIELLTGGPRRPPVNNATLWLRCSFFLVRPTQENGPGASFYFVNVNWKNAEWQRRRQAIK